MRIAICGPFPFDENDRANVNGLTQAVVTLAETLSADPIHDVAVVTRSSKVRRRVVREVAGVHVIYVPDRAIALDYMTGRRLLARRLMRGVLDWGPDVVHAHGEAPFIEAALRSGRPSVVTLHAIFAELTRVAERGMLPLKYRIAFSMMRRWEAAYLPRLRNLIAINDHVAEYAAARSPHARIYRIDNPIHPRFFNMPAEPREEETTILCVSRIVAAKGVHVLLAAFRRLVEEFPTWTLRVIGSTDEEPAYVARLEREFQEELASGRMQLLGGMAQAQVAEAMRSSAVVCLPSLSETSPLVVVEAMALGKPVVATRVGDIERTIGSDEAGVLVEPGDAESLAKALKPLLLDSRMRHRLGEAAREIARGRAEPNLIAQQTLSVYHEVHRREAAELTIRGP